MGFEYLPASFFPGIFYVLLGNEVSQEICWENLGMNFCKCMVKLRRTNYYFYQKKSLYSLSLYSHYINIKIK